MDYLDISGISITGNRKLKATWSMDAANDLAAFHGLNAAQSLTDILAAEINAEIDSEILADLRNNAGSTVSGQGHWGHIPGSWGNASWNIPPATNYGPQSSGNTASYQHSTEYDTVVVKPKQYRSIDDEWE